MPRINPIHLRRVNPITVSGAPGNVNLGAGTVATPRAASPAQAQFIGRDTQLPLVLGQQAADLANTLNSAITKRAQVLAAAEGIETARGFIKDQDTRYMGTPNQDLKTIPAFQSGKAYVQAGDQYLTQYDSDREKVAKSLDPAARLVFLQKTDGHRNEVYQKIQGRRYKEQTKYIQKQLSSVAESNARLIGDKAFRILSEVKTTLPEELKARTAELNVELSAEATRIAKANGVPLTVAKDTAIYNALRDIYSREEGDAVATLVEDQWLDAITDPDVKKKAQSLHTEYIDRHYKLLKAANDYADAEDKYAYQQREKQYYDEVLGLKHAGDAQPIIAKAYAYSPYEGQKVAALVKALTSNNSVNAENATFTAMAKLKGWSPSRASLIAEQNGVNLAKAQIEEIAKAWPTNVRHRTKDYVDRFSSEFQRLMGAQSDFASNIAALMSGGKTNPNNPAIRQFKMWKTEIQQGVEKALLSDGDPDDFYNKFVASRLNPDKINSMFLKFEPKDSIVPVGLFKKLPKDGLNSYTSVGVLINSSGMLSKHEKAQVLKLAEAADSTDLKVKKRAIGQLGQIYKITQSRIFKRTKQSDMYSEWVNEIPFQWFAIRAKIGDSE